MDTNLVISKGRLKSNQLAGKVCLITGAGGGIGYEAARSLIWLGAKVVIAEIDKTKGKNAEKSLTGEFGKNKAFFIHTDISRESSVKNLRNKIYSHFGHINVIINNATVTPLGRVQEVGLRKWDKSYYVNLRGPVLIVTYFLPEMLSKDEGTIAFVSSSGAAPYMGAYEVFKTAQVELANTLAAELEKTEVSVYAIGPGIVKTETAQKAISQMAPLYGKSVDEFYKMSENALLSVQEAGAGFAASVANAHKYRGLEIGSIQALLDIGILVNKPQDNICQAVNLSKTEREKLTNLFLEIKKIFKEQIEGWNKRPIFERQWVNRDFKKHMSTTPEMFLSKLDEFEETLRTNKVTPYLLENPPTVKIFSYYKHQMELLKGYEKDLQILQEHMAIIQGWLDSITEFHLYIDKLKDFRAREATCIKKN